jgi:8-oxo-dGTP pyrophosphatase MutT (NUDIX family)/predicted DNA-binding protein (MmcQ/YjbR family)
MTKAEVHRRIVRKSIGYVTRGRRVLFFRATETPEAGAELPGGTLEPDEDPNQGLLREIYEETGLSRFAPPRLLGVVTFDPGDGEEVHLRHFFHLRLLSEAPASWSRVVEEGNGTFTFNFFWAPVTEVPAHIYPGHDAFAGEVARLVESTSQEDARLYVASLPGVEESSHHGRPDLRVAGKIFATLPAEGSSVNVKITPQNLEILLAREPRTFTRVWGERWVGVRLEAISYEEMVVLLEDAWRLTAPKRLQRELDELRTAFS